LEKNRLFVPKWPVGGTAQYSLPLSGDVWDEACAAAFTPARLA